MHKKIISTILLAMIMITVISCAGENVVEGTNAPKNSDETTQTETIVIDESPEIVNYTEYEFRIMAIANLDDRKLIAEEMTGDTINDAVYIRNRSVEDKYNIKISEIIAESTAALTASVAKNVQANDDFADIVMIQAHSVFPVAQEGYLHNWYDFDEVRLDKPWWDQRITNELEIKGKIYTIIGEYTTIDELGTMSVFYNKKLLDDFNLDNVYELVTTGKWTFDRMWDMIITVSDDLNGDSIMDENDRYGMITEYSSLYYFYSGSGYRPIQPKGKGEYELVIGTEKATNIVEKILVIGTQNRINTMISDNGKLTGDYTTAKNMFKNNQGLFFAGSFGDIAAYRDMETDFGVLPIPKYDDLQESYYSLVTWNVQPASMPISVQDTARAALILEALAYESSLGLTDAFYDVYLGDKLARDEETIKMFDIIFASKTFDLDWYAKISGFLDILNNIGKSGVNNFTSEYAKIESQAQVKLNDFLSNFN